MSRTSDVALLILAIALADCFEPVQYGGLIPIDQVGASARLERVCAIGPHAMCAPVEQEAEDAGVDVSDGGQ